MQDISAKQLRKRADETRALADEMKHSPARWAMWQLAASYDLLARHALEREDREKTHEARAARKLPDRAA